MAHIDYYVKRITGNIDPKATDLCETDSYFRMEEPGIALANMAPNTTGNGPNHATQTRKSEAAIHDADYSTPRRYRGGGIRKLRLRWIPKDQSMSFDHVPESEMGERKCAFFRY